jgi:hypothetical protein
MLHPPLLLLVNIQPSDARSSQARNVLPLQGRALPGVAANECAEV